MLATIKQYFKAAGSWCLKHLIRAHVKRLMFVITLYHFLKQDNGEGMEDLEELNRTFRLARDSRALVLPGLAFTHWIWPQDQFQVTELRDEELVDKLLRQLPDWLRYGREEDLRKDIMGVQHFLGR